MFTGPHDFWGAPCYWSKASCDTLAIAPLCGNVSHLAKIPITHSYTDEKKQGIKEAGKRSE